MTRTRRWICGGCEGWRSWQSRIAACLSCGRELTVNEHQACRLCWRQTKLLQEGLPGRRRGPLDILGANRYGQQLFLANMSSSKNGYRPRDRAPAPPVIQALPEEHRRPCQLDLFTPDPIEQAARRYGFPDPPTNRLTLTLDRIGCEHAARHGWSLRMTTEARVAIRVLLGMRYGAALPIRASEVARLSALELPARNVMAILTDTGVLNDDRVPPIETWFERQVHGLPEPMTHELQIWFDVLYRGSTTPPRTRPRAPGTIKTRLTWARPTLQSWADAGHQSLREITRSHLTAALPGSGTPRAGLGRSLRSIFATLKAHGVLFVNPTTQLKVGHFERRIPLPADIDRLNDVLDSADPTAAALAALAAFHGLRPLELRMLQLTDLRDSRVHLPDRTVPLADPVKTRMGAYLDYRTHRWPNSANPYLFIHHRNAGATRPATRSWVNDRLGMSAQAIRQDRIIDEARATGGDFRRICDFFGVTIKTATHYTATLDHPNLANPDPSSPTQGHS